MTVIDPARLVEMANQIGDFFAPYPEQRRIEGVRNHLRNYWDPRMRSDLLAYVTDGHEAELLPHVLAATQQLQTEADGRSAYAGPPRLES
jgi:formate dehydrogenase subunit delta